MHARRSCSLLLAAMFSLALGGCPPDGGAGGNDNSASNDNTPNANANANDNLSADEQLRFQQLQKITDMIPPAPADGALPSADDTLAAIKDDPMFEAAGISPSGDVWARFTDGQPILIVASRPPPGPEENDPDATEDEAAAKPRQRSAVAVTPRNDVRYGVPHEVRFHALRALSGDYPTVSRSVSQMLQRHGYSAAEGGAADVETFRAVQGDGIFYIDAHGGLFQDDAGKWRYSVQTTAELSLENQQRYRDDIVSGRLTLIWVPSSRITIGGSRVDFPHYAITAGFVRKHMSFSSDSLVFLNTCAAMIPEVTEFRDACFEKGASAVIGWTGAIVNYDANASALYLFSRLLGENRQSRHTVVPPGGAPIPLVRASTPQRPFQIGDVLVDMATALRPYPEIATTEPLAYNKGTKHPPLWPSGPTLVIERRQKDVLEFGIPVPTIASASASDDGLNVMLNFTGDFGDLGADHRPQVFTADSLEELDRGGGMEIEVVDAVVNGVATLTASRLRARAPLEWPGGYVQARVGPRGSNIVAVSAWDVPVSFSRVNTTSDFTETATFTMHLRQVAQPFHAKPGDAAAYAPNAPVQATLLSSCVVGATGACQQVGPPAVPINPPFTFRVSTAWANGVIATRDDGARGIVLDAVWIEQLDALECPSAEGETTGSIFFSMPVEGSTLNPPDTLVLPLDAAGNVLGGTYDWTAEGTVFQASWPGRPMQFALPADRPR
ncbi:hypothetical protein RAS1_31180 [Phycisphaerae bacterium RAS1]|nr:hypothetical protein RAS1_31180 [Phycisphaerae bacterium RAS1]